LSNLLSESDVIVFSLLLLVSINIIGKDLVTLFSEIDSHRETHVTQTDKADFSKAEGILQNKIHYFIVFINITILFNSDNFCKQIILF